MQPDDSIKKRARKVVDAGSVTLAHLQESIQTNELLQEIIDSKNNEVPEEKPDVQKIAIEGISVVTLKGEDGKTPTEDELVSLIKPLIPEPIKGDTYTLTEKDKKDIAKSVKVPVVEKVIERTEVVIEKPIEKVVKEAVYEEPEAILDKINSIEEGIKQSSIKGLVKELKSINERFAHYSNRVFGIGSSGDTVVAGTNITITRNANGDKVINATSSGGGVSFESGVGTVDGVNKVFTVSNTPKYIVADGLTYFDGLGYVLAGLTITTDVAPVSFLKSAY